MSICRLLAVARKEFRHIARDARILFLVTFAPAFLLVTLSYVFAVDVERVDIAVRDLDRTPLSRELVSALVADGDLLLVACVERDEDVEPLFAREEADVVLVIPHGFTDAVLAGGLAEVQCIADGADAITAGQAVGLLESRVAAFAAGIHGPPSGGSVRVLTISDSVWYNEALKSLVSMVPGMLAVIMCMPALALALADGLRKRHLSHGQPVQIGQRDQACIGWACLLQFRGPHLLLLIGVRVPPLLPPV